MMMTTTRRRKKKTRTTIKTSARRARERGVALILVLWTLAAVSVLAAEFARAMHDEAASTRNFKESTHARMVAMAGVSEVILALKARREAGDKRIETQEEDQDNPDPVRALSHGDGQWVHATFRGNHYEVRVLDEAGRLSLNKTTGDQLRLIFQNLEVPENDAEIIADSIVDWRDRDDFHQPNGAESEYYEGLDRPYRAKNADFDTVEELLLVRGVTHDIFYGHDDIPGLRDIFSIFNKKARLNKNSITPQVMQALTGMKREDAEDFGTKRQGTEKDAALQQLSDALVAAGAGQPADLTPVDMTVEARVFDATGQTVLSHIGAVLHMNDDGDGLKLYRWYDSIFDESDRSGSSPAAADAASSQQG
jgi:general secretion pathway protein K